jgi:hypothetical protein
MKTTIVKIKHLAMMTGMAVSAIGGSGAITPANALTFTFTRSAATSDQAFAGFTAAGNLWSSLFTDNVNINISIDYSALSPGTLGQASSTSNYYTYQQFRTALIGDATTADDTSAVNSLAAGSTYKTWINHTSDSPKGSGSLTPYTYDSSFVGLTSANAKALGLIGNNTSEDASIAFSSSFTWDFDRSDGISGNAYDFVGVAAHEIGHALGFVSGVDYVDGYIDTSFQSSAVLALDLFRYSTASQAVNAIDITAGTTDKYFSLDNGATKIASFSKGVNFGYTCTPAPGITCPTPRQASHWEDNLGLGIMDPTAGNGELLKFMANDAQALDVIGWNRASNSTQIPEPADFAGTLICAAFGVKLVLKRRKHLADVTAKPKHDAEV